MPKACARIKKNCITCGKEFETLPNKKASAKKYCSFQCSVDIRITIPKTNCLFCGKEFQPKFLDRTNYCSKDCKENYKAYFKHVKEFNNEFDKQKMIEKRNKMQAIKDSTIFICKQCNKEFTQHYIAVPKGYCSDECEKEYTKEYSKQRDKIKSDEKKANTIYKCKVCETVFTPEYKDKKRYYCSDDCKQQAMKEYSHTARVNREIRKKGAFVAPVYRKQIFKRDNYTCMLCGQFLNMNVVSPHPLSPSIDHVIPLSKNGTHEPGNVQAAHLICNSHKGNRELIIENVQHHVEVMNNNCANCNENKANYCMQYKSMIPEEYQTSVCDNWKEIQEYKTIKFF